eukprot:scaffold14734_cov137-Amphora_coffeaeformis.AAC.2
MSLVFVLKFRPMAISLALGRRSSMCNVIESALTVNDVLEGTPVVLYHWYYTTGTIPNMKVRNPASPHFLSPSHIDEKYLFLAIFRKRILYHDRPNPPRHYSFH